MFIQHPQPDYTLLVLAGPSSQQDGLGLNSQVQSTFMCGVCRASIIIRNMH